LIFSVLSMTGPLVYKETWIYRVFSGALLLNDIRHVYRGRFWYGLWHNIGKCVTYGAGM
jgi:hypothetical protein